MTEKNILQDIHLILKDVDQIEKNVMIKFLTDYLNLSNGSDFYITGLSVKENVLRNWYGYLMAFIKLCEQGYFDKEIENTVYTFFRFHAMTLIMDENNHYSEIAMKAIAVNGRFEIALDTSFCEIIFNTHMLIIMSLIHNIPEEKRLEYGNFIVDNYMIANNSNIVRVIL